MKITEETSNYILAIKARWFTEAFLFTAWGFWSLVSQTNEWNDWVGNVLLITYGFLITYVMTINYTQAFWPELDKQGIDYSPAALLTMDAFTVVGDILIFLGILFCLSGVIPVFMMFAAVCIDTYLLVRRYRRHRELFELIASHTSNLNKE